MRRSNFRQPVRLRKPANPCPSLTSGPYFAVATPRRAGSSTDRPYSSVLDEAHLLMLAIEEAPSATPFRMVGADRTILPNAPERASSSGAPITGSASDKLQLLAGLCDSAARAAGRSPRTPIPETVHIGSR
jgi:hypothetical protein